MSGQTYYPERTAADLPVFDYGELLDSAEPLFGVYFYHCVLNYNNCPIKSQKIIIMLENHFLLPLFGSA